MDSYVIKVKFKEDGKEFFFGSFASMYERFTGDELGISKWKRSAKYGNLTPDKEIITEKCTITRHLVQRKSQKNR